MPNNASVHPAGPPFAPDPAAPPKPAIVRYDSAAVETRTPTPTPTPTPKTSPDLGAGGEEIGVRQLRAEEIDATFRGAYIDLTSASLDGRVLARTDEWFAPASNLLTRARPVHKPGVFTHTGAWYDGWETRRHNDARSDWALIRLGVHSGTVRGVEIDTAFFNGNHAPEVSVEGCFVPEEEAEAEAGTGRTRPSTCAVTCAMTGAGAATDAGTTDTATAATKTVDSDIGPLKGGDGCTCPDGELEAFESWPWEPILPRRPCGPNQRHGWVLDRDTRPYTHVRVHMYPDGGIARFRLYGTPVLVLPRGVVPNGTAHAGADADADANADPGLGPIDLAAATNGGTVPACSDQHFSRADNVLLPGRGGNMGDGWETKRSRARGHVDWAIVRLAVPAWRIDSVVVDTAFFRGNFPREVRVDVIWEEVVEDENEDDEKKKKKEEERGNEVPSHDDARWTALLGPRKMKPDTEHVFGPGELVLPEGRANAPARAVVVARWVKLVIVPDGGVMRFRVFARPFVGGVKV